MDLSEQRRLPAGPVAVWSPHPLQPAAGRELIHAELYPGETLGDYLRRIGLWPKIAHRAVRVAINGAQVPRSMWPHCRPKPGTLIEIRAAVAGGGGGGGKNPLKTVLSIALMVAAPQLAPGLAAQLGVTSALGIGFVQAGIGIIGSIALNAVFPPPKPNLSRAQGGFGQESPTYSLSGGSNRMRPYEPMPVIMGVHRVFPDAGARTYTEFHGDDQILFQVFDFGYNDLDLSDFRIGSNPVGSYNDITIQVSGPDGRLTLFPGNVDTAAGAAMIYGQPATVRTSSPNATALALDFEGTILSADSADGSIGLYGVALRLQYRAVGSATWLDFLDEGSDTTIYNASRKLVRRTFFKSVPEGQYEVRVERLSLDTNPKVIGELTWTQMRTYQADTADYTGRTRVAVKIKASGQLNGAVDQFSAIARAKTEVWNGSAWVTAQTSNPAWWVLAAARGRFVGGRRVWGGGIDDSRIGLDNLKDFAAWCDSKALTFNGVFDQPMSVQDMLDSIALCGRGTVSNGTGKLEVVWDAPAQPVVAVIGMSNIQRDSFEIEYTTEELADEVVMSFINPETEWQRDVVRKLAPGVTSPLRSRQLELFGCTSRDQAGRAANLYIATNEFRTRRYKWRMDWEAMPLSRGEVAAFSHDLASYDYSGRLVSGSTASVLKLERRVPLNAEGAWVTLVKPNGSFATYAVQGGVGDSDTLTLVTPLAFNPGADPDHPPFDYRWLYGHTATPGRKVKIDAIRPVSHDTVELTAIDEIPEYYTAEAEDYLYHATKAAFGVPQISNLQAFEDGVRAGNGYLAKVGVTWEVSGDYRRAEVRLGINGSPLELMGETDGRSFELTVSDGSQLLIEVTAYSSLGQLGSFARATLAKTVNFAALFPPTRPASFSIAGDTFTFAPSPEVDVVGYRIAFHLGERRTWADAAPLHQGLITESPYRPPSLPAGQVSFGIKSVDAAGLESEEAAWVMVNLGDPEIANVIETIDLQALGWPGDIAGGSVVGDDIVADTETALYGPLDSAPIYTTAGAPFYPAAVYAGLSYETPAILPSAPLVGSRLTIAADITGDPRFIEWRPTGPAPLYSGEDLDPLYTDDAALMFDAAPGYTPWPGFIVVRNEPYQFRVRTGQGATEGRIAQLVLEIDAPDLEQEVEDLVVAPGGTRIPLAVPFSVIKNLQLTLEDDGGAAVSARILDKNAALGPLIECIDETQSSVAGRVDARIKGY